MSSRSKIRWLLALLALFICGPLVVRCQERGLEELAKELGAGGKYRDILYKLLRGDVTADPNNAEHVEAISAQTEYHVRRFFDPVYLQTPPNPPLKDKDKTLGYLVERIDNDLKDMKNSKNDVRAVKTLYSRQFGEHAKAELFRNGAKSPVAALNLTRALANVAALGQAELGDVLVDIIEADLKKDAIPEPERLKNIEKVPNDGVKYYALRGLQTLLLPPPAGAGAELTPAQEKKFAGFLVRFINIGKTFKESTPIHEIDGFRVRRREAIKALAGITKPSAPEKKASAALTLLRVVARTGLTPEPSMDERVEAAIGLARQKFSQDKGYNPDVAIYYIGQFLSEFGSFCNTENVKLQRPVKVYAGRMIEALDVMKAEIPLAAGLPADVVKRTGDGIDKCQLLLSALEKSNDGKLNPNEVKNLQAWFEKSTPKDAVLFKDVPESAIEAPKVAPKEK